MFCQCRAVTPNYAMNTMSISDTFDTFQHPLQLVNLYDTNLNAEVHDNAWFDPI